MDNHDRGEPIMTMQGLKWGVAVPQDESYHVRTQWFSSPEEIYEFDSLVEARACIAWAEYRRLWWVLESHVTGCTRIITGMAD